MQKGSGTCGSPRGGTGSTGAWPTCKHSPRRPTIRAALPIAETGGRAGRGTFADRRSAGRPADRRSARRPADRGTPWATTGRRGAKAHTLKRVTSSDRLYSTLMRRDPDAEAELDERTRANLPGNAMRLVGAHALQSSGDQTVNASTMLPWLLHALGVHDALTGLHCPIRTSGSMLPQAMLTPVVLRVRQRKWVFVTGALIQSGGVAAMALTAAVGSGRGAGIIILAALAVFSLGRSLTAMSSKDVPGRPIDR